MSQWQETSRLSLPKSQEEVLQKNSGLFHKPDENEQTSVHVFPRKLKAGDASFPLSILAAVGQFGQKNNFENLKDAAM